MKDEGVAQLERELELQQQQLEQLQLALDDCKRDHEQLSYTVSHDLQEPLRMVVNFVSLLKKRYEYQFDGKALEYINYAVDGAQRMQKMLGQLLKYSRINTKGGPFEPIDLGDCLKEVLKGFKGCIDEYDVEFNITSLPTVNGDSKQIKTLFEHIIDNSIQYRSGERHLKVDVQAKAKGAFWQVSVCDNGIGIDSKNMQKVFELFSRLDLNVNPEGVGMGLAYCRQIVRRHGGEIRVDSSADQGTCVGFTLLG